VKLRRRDMQRKMFGYVRTTIKGKGKEEQIESIKKYCADNGFDINEREIVVDANIFRQFK
ncbi:hypothetical protein, partial [Bacillus velezensis]